MSEALVVLTGDVHHTSLRTVDQRYLTGTEASTVPPFLEIAREHGVKATLFVTGLVVREAPDIFQAALRDGGVELGGHGYLARHPRWLYRGVFGRLLRRGNGPAWYQDLEIRATRRELRRTLGTEITSWRDHGYHMDRNTYALLDRNRFLVVSDEVAPDAWAPHRVGEALYSLPVNVPPDHDHVVHGALTPETAPHGLGRSRFPATVLSPEQWLAEVEAKVQAVAERGGVATILAHPACMEIADGFRTFRELCSVLAGHRTLYASEAPAVHADSLETNAHRGDGAAGNHSNTG